MVKGVAVNLKSFEETVPKILKMIKFDDELKKHEKIVLKPNLISGDPETCTNVQFAEQVLKFVIENRNPGTEVFIAEGCDGQETEEVYQKLGYNTLAEKYGIGLLDLNQTESEEIENPDFLKFDSIHYPKILSESFVISIPSLKKHDELKISASLDNMIGAYPAKNYRGFFSSGKNKLHKYDLKYQIHDIIKCKVPDFAIIDASELGLVLVGQPLEMDKQAAKAAGFNWREIPHIKLVDESLSSSKEIEKEIEELIGEN